MPSKYPVTGKDPSRSPNQSAFINPNINNIPVRSISIGLGALALGLATIAGINYLNEDSETKAFAPRGLANPHTATVGGGKITLEEGATLRANPVVNNDGPNNTVCMVGIDQGPVDIKAKKVTLANGVDSNPNDPNGPWVMVDLDNLPADLKSSCADGIQRDGDGKGWVSIKGGKIDVHLK